MVTATLDSWWPTPVLVIAHDDPQLNERLAEIILSKEREIQRSGSPTPIAGVETGLTAFWLKYNVLNWEYPECKAFCSMVLDGFKEFLTLTGHVDDPEYQIKGISCWANVLRYGESLAIHHHDPGFMSAHYTVRSGNKNPGIARKEHGNTIYYRPGFIEKSQGDEAFGGPWDKDWKISVPATEGRLTFFPSYVRHEVKANLGERERISIALDIYIEKQRNMPFYFAPPRWFIPDRPSTKISS